MSSSIRSSPRFRAGGGAEVLPSMQLSGAPEIDLDHFGSGSKPLAEA
jgi:hypothetical protein